MAWGLRIARSRDADREVIQPAPPSPPPRAAAPAAGTSLNALRQALLDLYGQRMPRDEFAAHALDLITRSLNAIAAAFLAYDQRRDRLLLVNAMGLSPQACQVLGGASGAPGWDIPARGLANRRISVIEAAHQNPFVPRPLIELSPHRLTIATLPIFHGYAPAGVLVVFSGRPQGFSDAQLQLVAPALKVCGLAFAELPHVAPAQPDVAGAPASTLADAEAAPRPAVLDRQRATDAQEIARLRAAFDEALWSHAKELAETRRAAAEALEAERERFASVGSTLSAAEAERDRLATQLAAARSELAMLADTRAALDAHTADAQRLKEALATATAAGDFANARLAELQRAHGELVAQHEAALRQQAEAAEVGSAAHQRDAAAIAGLREDLGRAEAEHTGLRATQQQLVAQLDAGVARAATLEQQLGDGASARRALEAQLSELRAAYESTLQRVATAEDTAARAQHELSRHASDLSRERDTLQQELARALAHTTELDRAAAAARAERERIAAEREEAVSQREQQIAAVQAQLAETVARHAAEVGERSADIERAAREHAAVTAALRQAEDALTAQAEQVQRLETELAAAASGHTALRAEVGTVTARYTDEVAALRRQLAEAEATLETSRRDQASLAAERTVAADAGAALQREVEVLRATLAATAATLEQDRAAAATAQAQSRTDVAAARADLAAAQQRLAAQDDELQRRVRDWESDHASLRARNEELAAELERTRRDRSALAEALAADESEPALEIERCVIPGADAAEALAVEESVAAVAAGDAHVIAVIDGDLRAPIAAAIQHAGWNTVECEPTDAAVDQLAARTLGGIAINVLAGSNGWQVVRSLRERVATHAVPLLLYAKQSEAAGFCFGPADCVLWPSEPQRLLDALARLAPRARRVLAMSSDIDVVATVREQLTGAGLSAAVMLDGRQALELLPSVRPDAIVLHLSPSCVDVFRTVAGLRADPATASLPVVFLIDRTPTSRDASFLSGGTRTLANKGSLGAAAVADALSRVIAERTNGSTAPPIEGTLNAKRINGAAKREGWVG